MTWSLWIWEQLVQDLRYSLRAMQANKLFTLLATLSLALGIGANTAIYSFMDAIMLRALPVRQPDRLVLLNWRAPAQSGVVNSHTGSSYPDAGGAMVSPNYPYHAYEFLRANQHSFSTVFAFANAGRMNLLVDGQALLGEGEYVSGDYFAGLGVTSALGRLISPSDDQPSAPPVAAISYTFWQTRFGGSHGVLGKSILINGHPFVVAGVTPPEFFGVRPPRVPDVFIPVRDLPLVNLDRYRDTGAFFSDDHTYWIEMMGRLNSDASLAGAQSELGLLFQHWVTQTARNDNDRATLPKLWLEPGGSGVDSLRRQYSQPLLVLMTMVALILAIACANIANLLLSRAASRRREIAVRLSLGAGRLRVIRQLLTESVLLALAGALLGVFVAAAGIKFLTLLLGNGDKDFTLNAQLDWHVLLFSLTVALATGVLFGLAPAIQATRINLTPALKEIRASDPRGRLRRFNLPFGLRHMLVVLQIAFSMLLVAAAGLFVRTLSNLNSVDLGFNQENILLFNLDGAQAGYKDQRLADLYADLQRRFGLIPGVRAATLTDMPLVSNWNSSTNVIIPGLPKEKGQNTALTAVGPGFFTTMQIPILAGRPIDDRDHLGAAPVAVVNQEFARKYFPGVSPLGRHFHLGSKERGPDLEIVGLAKSARYSSLKDEIPPVTYTSYLQDARNGQLQQMYFELRTSGDPLLIASTVRNIVHSVCPHVPVADVRTQTQAINETISQERTFAALCTCFGVLALIIACVGLYATTAYGVTRRTNEIGIRVALGAMKWRIIWMVVSEVILLGLVGLAFGLAGVWEVAAFLKSFLWGLPAHDSATFTAAAIILLLCTLIAGFAPAWRAARIDPLVALRHE